jgi:hypothetical protein
LGRITRKLAHDPVLSYSDQPGREQTIIVNGDLFSTSVRVALVWDRHHRNRSEELLCEICLDGNIFFRVTLVRNLCSAAEVMA